MSQKQVVLLDKDKTKLVQGTEQEFLAEHLEDVALLKKELFSDDGEELYVIEDDDDYQFIGDLLKHVKKRKAEIESRRKEVTKPLNDALTAFRKWYKPSIDLWELLEKLLKRKMEAWNLQLLEQRAAARRQIEAAVDVGDYDAAHEASALVVEASKIEGVSVIDHWEVDLEKVDISKAPPEFLMLDMDACNLYIKEFGKGKPKDLPGIPFKKAFQIKGSKKG